MNPQKEESGFVEAMSKPGFAEVAAREAGSSAPLPLAEGAPAVAVDVEMAAAAAVEGVAADVVAAFPS